MPSWSKLRSKRRQRLERSSPGPGIREGFETLERRAWRPPGLKAEARGFPAVRCSPALERIVRAFGEA
eukprot:3307571-Alexandrium_andersonii.AAC.1